MTQNNLHLYQAHAFHEQFSGGRTAGNLEWDMTRVCFTWDGGRVEIPASELQLKLGGANSRLIFLSHHSLPQWSFYTADHQFLEDSYLQDHNELALMAISLKRKKAGQWVAPILVLALLVLAIAGLFAARPWIVGKLANQVPPSWEEKLGNAVFAQYSMGMEFVSDAEVERHLETLTSALTDHLPDKRYTFKFHIVADPTLNAFALPGGHVVLNSGAIHTAEAAEELLGVLAHEIAHVNQRHSIKAMINSMGIVLLAQTLIGDSTALFAVLNEAAPYLLNQQFSRENERDADITGLGYLKTARIDARGMEVFFQRIEDTSGKGNLLNEELNFLNTHPSTRERIQRIQDHIASSDPSEYRDFGTLLNDLKKSLDAVLVSSETKKEGNNENNH